MEKIFAKRTITISELLGLDENDKDDRNYLLFFDTLVALDGAMIKKDISKNELARRLGVSRQAIYDKFSGRNVTMGWVKKACDAIGVELRFLIIDKEKARKKKKSKT